MLRPDNATERGSSATPASFAATVFTSTAPLAKHFELREGAAVGHTYAHLSEGEAQRVSFDSLTALGERMRELTPHQALCFGVFEHEHCAVRSAAKAERYSGTLPLVQRSRAFVRWPSGLGVMLLDYDPPSAADALDADALVAALRRAEPALERVGMLWRPSSSSHLHSASGEELRGLRGQHIYLIVDDAQRIPAVGEALTARLWLAGLGHAHVTGSGRVLPRTPIDAAVWQPERLVFACASTGKGVEQRMSASRVFAGGILRADSLEPLTDAEHARVRELQSSAAAGIAGTAAAQREAWVAARTAGKPAAERERYEAAADGGALPADLTIELAEGGSVTVADILANPVRYGGARCADPLEPDYRGDARIAMIVTAAHEPHIHSHVHGGMRYALQSEAERSAAIAAGLDVIAPETLAVIKRAKAARFAPVPWDEFAARDAPTWIVQGVVPRAELGVIYGESGSGKTFFVLDLVAAVARSAAWRERPVSGGRVVYVCAEGAGGFQKRIAAYAQAHGISERAGLQLDVIADAPDLLSADHEAMATAIGRADVIVIDTLAQTTAGANENSGEDMGKALSHCKALHRATGAVVLLVHHAGKDAARGARGWSGIRAACDFEVAIERGGPDGVRTARVTKQKDGEDGAAFHFKLQPVGTAVDDGSTFCTVIVADAPARARQAPRGETQRVVLDVVESAEFDAPNDAAGLAGGIARDTLIAQAASRLPPPAEGKRDARRQHASRALEALLESGHLVRVGNDVRPPRSRHRAAAPL